MKKLEKFHCWCNSWNLLFCLLSFIGGHFIGYFAPRPEKEFPEVVVENPEGMSMGFEAGDFVRAELWHKDSWDWFPVVFYDLDGKEYRVDLVFESPDAEKLLGDADLNKLLRKPEEPNN